MISKSIRSKQTGITLVEIMVSLAVSMFILSGVIGVFIGNKQSFRVQQNMAAIQENGRFALDAITRSTRMAGFQGVDAGEWVLGPLTTAYGGVDALSGTDGAGTASDTITLVYSAPDANQVDCQGNYTTAGNLVYATYSIATTATTSDLQCSTAANGTGAVTLVEDIENMQFLYGIDTDGDSVANKYDSISGITAADDIVAIKIAMLARSPDDNVALATESRTRTLLDVNVYTVGVNTADDKRIRRDFTTTARLRNRL